MMSVENYTNINAKAINSWAEGGWEWSIVTSLHKIQKIIIILKTILKQ